MNHHYKTMAIDIAGIYVPALARPQASADPDPRTSLRLKEMTAGLLNGKYDSASFTPAMRVFLSTATGKAVWRWTASHGALKSFTFSECEDAADSRIVRYKVVLGENPYWFSARVTWDGRVAQICWW
jgi:hypothetical protein